MKRADRRRAKHRLWNAVVASGLALPVSGCGARTALPTPDAQVGDAGLDADEDDGGSTFDLGTLPPPFDSAIDPVDVGDTPHPHITK